MRSLSLAALLVAALPLSAQAGKLIQGPVAIASGTDETALFAGLNWTFGAQGNGPSAAVGVIRSEVDAAGDVKGAILSFNIGLQGGDVGDVRLVGFTGNGDIAGQLGLGIDFDGSGTFGVGGFLTNYAQGGLTFGFNGDVGGFLGIHSYQFLEPRMEMPPA
jgi:hypothetical protein